MARSPFAYVCPKRQIYVVDANGKHSPQTKAGESLVWGSWAINENPNVGHSWPTWSPDGKRIACFRLPQGGTPRVLVLEVNGIQSAELVDLGSRLPVYMFWSPNGEHIAVLSQFMDEQQDRLGLTCLRPEHLGSELKIAEGTPLFFTWFKGRLATYVGSEAANASTLSVIDPNGHRPTEILPAIPSNFCAPLAIGDRLYYVGQHSGLLHVMDAAIGDPEPKLIESADGLVGLVASPDGTMIARAIAPGGDGTAYRNLSIINVSTGEIQTILDIPCLGYFWTPNSEALTVVSVDTARNLMTWSVVNLDGDVEPIAEMIPTRDFGFYLRFFEQYSQSHPIINNESSHLMVSGELLDIAGHKEDGCGTWEIPLDGSRPVQVSDGVFAVYGPR